MQIDPYVQQLKGKNVIAMVSVEETQVEYYYIENHVMKKQKVFGNRYKLFEQYAMVCGLLWKEIGVGKGASPCRNFMNGRLFVPLRKPKGLMYVDLKYYKGIVKRDGHSFIEFIDDTLIECCQSAVGNEGRIAEAKKVAASLPGFGNDGLVRQEAVNLSTTQGEVPDREDSLSLPASDTLVIQTRKRKAGKRNTMKEGALTQDVMDAFLLNEEIRSRQWQHAQGMDHKSLAYKRMQSKKKSEMEVTSAAFYELLVQCDQLHS